MNAMELLERAAAVLESDPAVAVVGASADPEKYGYELVEVLSDLGLEVLPVNPKRSRILERPCAPSVEALPERPDVLVMALAPEVTEQVVAAFDAAPADLLWLPPGCFTERAERMARSRGWHVLAGICPVMAARAVEQRRGVDK